MLLSRSNSSIIWLAAAARLLSLTPMATASPRVAVVDSPVAMAWLRSAGVECLPVAAAALGTSMPDAQLIVLPMDRLRSVDALPALTALTARGGKVIAIYWGTLARPEQQSNYPVYGAASALGVKVIGWTLTGPAVAKPEAPAARDARDGFSPGSRSPASPSASLVPEIRMDQWMMIRVEPEPSAQVLARLAPVSGAAPLVLALRNGNMFYVAANLFHRGSDAPELRRLFFWILDQAAPGLVFAQARERPGAAIAAVIRARARLPNHPTAAAEPARQLLDQADEAAERAKSLAERDQYVDAIAAADQARELTERALAMMGGP